MQGRRIAILPHDSTEPQPTQSSARVWVSACMSWGATGRYPSPLGLPAHREHRQHRHGPAEARRRRRRRRRPLLLLPRSYARARKSTHLEDAARRAAKVRTAASKDVACVCICASGKLCCRFCLRFNLGTAASQVPAPSREVHGQVYIDIWMALAWSWVDRHTLHLLHS